MVKAIFLDVDGTMVSFRTHRASPELVQALHTLHEKGIKLFVATGRHPALLSYVRSLFPFDGWVTLSGQYCYCGERVLRSCPMDRRAVEELVAAVRTNAFSCLFFEEKEVYVNYVDDYSLGIMRELEVEVPPVRDPARALEHPLYQAIPFLSREKEHLLLDQAPHLKTTRWHPHFLDVIPPTGGKDCGMDAILEYFHIPLEECMAFGDGENDVTMLRHAGIGVAMGSAHQTVKDQADYVAPGVDEDGVIRALEHFGVL